MKTEILTRTECNKCNGQGIITNPLWEEFDKADEEFKKERGRYMKNSEIIEYWLQKGFYEEHIPPEEINCPHCKGSGYIQEWIPVDRLTYIIKK